MASPAYRLGDRSGRIRFAQTSMRILIALLLAVLSLPLLTAASVAAGVINGFEIDGNRADDSAGGHDWESGSVTSPVGSFSGYDHYNDGDGAANGDDVFQHANEPDAPSGWGTKTGKTDDGSDIVDVYTYYTMDTSGNAWFYLGFSRTTVGVTAHVIELNQLANQRHGDLPMPQRSEGDVRITFTQTNGNTQFSHIDADIWTGNSWGGSPVLDDSTFQGSAGEGGLFGEIGVNLSAAGLQAACSEGFTAVNVRSRSSDAPRSSLKDYVKAVDVKIPPRCRDLIIEKQGVTTEGASPLSGASFTVTPDPTTAMGESLTVTDGGANDPDGVADGVIPFRTSRFAEYSVIEVDPPLSSDAYGWVLDPQIRRTTVSLTHSGSVTFINSLGSVAFTKTDQTNGTLVGGASFELTKTSGAHQASFTVTDNAGRDLDPAHGNFLIKDLKVGDWSVTELDTSSHPAPPGYEVPSPAPTETFSVTHTRPDAVLAEPFANPRKPATLVVEKRDAGTAELVTGSGSAVFRLYEDSRTAGTVGQFDAGVDQPVGDDKTSDEGAATWTGLPWGTYLVEEVTPPNGYQPKTGAARFIAVDLSVDDVDEVNELTTVTFRNERRVADIWVEKYSLETPQVALTGARFRLFKDDGDGTLDADDQPVGEIVTAKDGTQANSFTWTGLPWGSYLVKEVTPPDGYTFDPQAVNGARHVELSRGETSDGATFFDEKLSDTTDPENTITVTKSDADHPGLLVDGASFELYVDENDNSIADQGELIDSNPSRTGTGTYEWTELPNDKYLVKEATPPPGYKAPTADTVVVHAMGGGTYPVGFANEQLKSMIVVTKIDEQTGAEIDGATFELRRNGTIVADAPIHLTRTGVYTWAGLPMGEYTVTEVAPPAGYLGPDEDSLPADGVEAVNIDAQNAGGTFPVTFENEQKKSDIIVVKYDATDNVRVDGADFDLYQGGVPVPGEPRRTHTGTYIWEDLLMGRYEVKEAAPPANYLPPTPANATQEVLVTSANAGTQITVEFFNEKASVTDDGKIVVTKVDADNNAILLNGAKFQLYRDGGTLGEFDPSDDKPVGDVVITKDDGTGRWTDLAAGAYLLVEVSPPTGYQLATDNIQAVELAEGEEEGVTFENQLSVPDTNNPNPDPDPDPTPAPNPTPGTTIVVTKRDATTQVPIDTATFQLWQDANANGRLDATLDTEVGTAKTTANGVVSWASLTAGTYFAEETVAPKGYELPDNTVLTIAVDATMAGKTLSRSFYDPQRTTTVEVVKQDDHTHEVLAGATFQAYADVDADGLVSDGDVPVGDPQLTDENGVVSWSGLGFGHYLVEEVAPPAGYGLPTTTSMPVVLDRDNAGGTVRLVFLDPALGTVSIVKVALELNAAGEWVASDGEVKFGDRVKYVLTATASGPKVFQAVEVSDFIPGYDPADTKSTTQAGYVDGSARCIAVACAVSFDAASQQLTWSLRELRDQQRSMEFVVRMPDLPADPVFTDGELTETVVNVGELSWREYSTTTTQRLSGEYAARTIRSNEVVTTIAERPLVLDTPPADRPEPGEKPEQGLPETGAPHNSGLITTVGSLSLLLGAWLMLTSRRRGFLPQH